MAGKKILILGNGFDLAHGLPTCYSDFLKYCDSIHSKAGIEFVHSKEIVLFKADKGIYLNIIKNIWFYYFRGIYAKSKIKGENWIDFESEISFIISFLDKSFENLLKSYKELLNRIKKFQDENFEKLKLDIFVNYLHHPIFVSNVDETTIRDIRKKCFGDLEKLTKALEIYILEFVEKKNINGLDMIKNINPDYIINFNYTHTYEKLYGNKENVFHIHGECGKKENNMVLGIDEYWAEEECDKHTNYAIFKKFVQRIRKKTGTTHIKWLNEINNIYQTKNEMSDIYVFGHSLDITDKDILKEFFTSEATRIHIYCKDAETEGELIANVIKLMGEENLLQKVNQELPKIEFILQ